jgi:exopolysaccharide biosynthesis polyprenyl glycosylphosphotransferase
MFVDAVIFSCTTLFLASRYAVNENVAVVAAVLFTSLGIYVLFLKGFYKIRKYDFFLKDAYLLFEGIVLAASIPAVIMLFLEFTKPTLNFFIVDIFWVYIFIYVWRAIFYCHRRYLKPSTNILILGAGKVGKILVQEILSHPMLKINIVGFIDNDDEKADFEYKGIKVIGKTSDLAKIIEENEIKTVIVAIMKKIKQEILMDISECIPQGVDIWKMPDYYERITQKIPVLAITPEWFMYDFTSIERPLYNFLKRIFDIVAASIILFLTFPILVFIAFAIKICDGGAIIYTQKRVGKYGKSFEMYKMRTMYEGADKVGMVDKGNTKDDRVIPFCKWVRKARFDEIPQMINIIKGEMSIVGPRAEFEEFVKKYEQEIPFYTRRHWVTPGWTGWAQINQGHCVNVDAIIEKLRYDFYYIKHCNIFWDFSILMKAVTMALTGRHG